MVIDDHAPCVYQIWSIHVHNATGIMTEPVMWVPYIHLIQVTVASHSYNTILTML